MSLQAHAAATVETAQPDAVKLMLEFAERTGLTGAHEPRRYLWTDAFAVCNFLAIARAQHERDRALSLALDLVAQVHHVLGRHRPDDARAGWISGLAEAAGEAHPTRGGLRIGKPLRERPPDERFDSELEWERDGQYFHYLTKWMHALDRLARASGNARFSLWAHELAAVAYQAFAYDAGGGRKRMFWKLSIDLSHPLVPSMGHHDPLDGLVTCVQLQKTATLLGGADAGPSLEAAVADFAAMIGRASLATTDPLGLGGLLLDACRVERLTQEGPFADGKLLCALLDAAHAGLLGYLRMSDLRASATRRLAFRELGLAIGLRALEQAARDRQRFADGAARARLEQLLPRTELGMVLAEFWLDARHHRSHTWLEHRDINEVMLASALVPDACLILGGDAPALAA